MLWLRQDISSHLLCSSFSLTSIIATVQVQPHHLLSQPLDAMRLATGGSSVTHGRNGLTTVPNSDNDHHSSYTSNPTSPPPSSRGFKTFFSRARSPEPQHQFFHSSSSSQPKSSACSSKSKLRSLLEIRAHHPTRPPRAPSPDHHKSIRFAPSDIPAITRGNDGKWQPPSLSKGSMSTSALAELAGAAVDVNGETNRVLSPSKRSTSVLFHSQTPSQLKKTPPPLTGRRTKVRTDTADGILSGRTGDGNDRDAAKLYASPPISPTLTSPVFESAQGKGSLQVEQQQSRLLKSSASSYHSVPLGTSQPTPTSPPRVPKPPPTPLSRDHYLIRLSTSFIVKSLTPIIRGTEFTQNTKNASMRQLADDRLSALARIERSWGGDWTRLASSPEDANLENKVRAANVGDVAKGRERKVWVDNLKDGILLCFLMNHLFPARPSRIPRVNISEDALRSDTNFIRFISACQDLEIVETCGMVDMDGSESGAGRVAGVVIALARLAGPSPLRSRSPAKTSSRPPSRPPSRQASTSASPSRPTSPSPKTAASPRLPANPKMPISPSQPTSPKLNSNLNTISVTSSPKSLMETSPIPEPPSMVRSATQPAPIVRAVSPLQTSPSRLRTSPNRPTLRPRLTAGSRTSGASVSFAQDSSLHVRERTPSLVSSNSRVTSGYTRSSTAMSVSTITGDDQTTIDVADDDDLLGRRASERRMSEKTLHEARQKIFASFIQTPDDVDVSPIYDEEARGVAISQSLAALEGARTDSRPVLIRPASRRNVNHDNRDVDTLNEEDENDSNGSRVSHPISRNRSRNGGKFYIPKRSISPMSPEPSPTNASFAIPAMSGRAERRRSEGLPHERAELDFRPMSFQNHSMINLTLSSRPSTYREASKDSMVKGSATSQVLEFTEKGRPSIRYQLGNCIGRGQFGSVYRSLNLLTGQMVAIKRIRLSGMKESEVNDVMTEVELLQRLSHPSIVKYEGMSRDAEYLNIILEFVENGSLGQTLKAFGKFNEQLVSSYVAKILEGLDYLHSEGVVHCDLKAANILSTKNGNIKLTDFGVSLNMRAIENIAQDAASIRKDEAPRNNKGLSDIAGTPNWMAPEVIKLAGASPASDIWSLGCTIIELLTGKPPYAEIGNSMTVLFRIVEDDMPPLPETSQELADFLRLCFIKEPKQRPSAAVLFQHNWVQDQNPGISLRPQDSIPFLRRVSQDFRRVDSQRLFADIQSIPASTVDLTEDQPRRSRYSMNSALSHGRDPSDGQPRAHVMVKTTFAKAITCRVCQEPVRKVGVLCRDCGLICHAKCASLTVGRCDVREQLALLAYQQTYNNGSSPSVTSPPIEDPDTSGLTKLPARLFDRARRTKPIHLSPSQIDMRSSGRAVLEPGDRTNTPDSRRSRGSEISDSSEQLLGVVSDPILSKSKLVLNRTPGVLVTTMTTTELASISSIQVHPTSSIAVDENVRTRKDSNVSISSDAARRSRRSSKTDCVIM